MLHEENYIELIGKYLAGELSDEQTEQLMNWVNAAPENRMLFEDLTTVWKNTEDINAPAPEGVEEVWSAIEQKIESTGIRKMERRAKPFRFLKIAAAIVFLLGAIFQIANYFFSPEEQMVALQTGPNENRQHKLPDGSIVWLNELTKLSYSKSFKQRQVNLEGEAFFDIVKKEGARFSIASGTIETVVLGTAFNVRAYPEETIIEVTVERGKVAFKDKTSDKQKILEKGDRGVYQKAEKVIVAEKNVNQNVLAWKSKRFAFNDTPVYKVIDALERYYRINIEVNNPAILNCTFKGNFKDPELSTLLETLSFGLKLSIEEQNNTYVFDGPGCE